MYCGVRSMVMISSTLIAIGMSMKSATPLVDAGIRYGRFIFGSAIRNHTSAMHCRMIASPLSVIVTCTSSANEYRQHAMMPAVLMRMHTHGVRSDDCSLVSSGTSSRPGNASAYSDHEDDVNSTCSRLRLPNTATKMTRICSQEPPSRYATVDQNALPLTYVSYRFSTLNATITGSRLVNITNTTAMVTARG